MAYKWGLIDANFFLRRNFKAAKGMKTLLKGGYENLVRSFLATVFSYQEQFRLQNIILAWDRYPYKKLETIKEYKSNRHYANKSDLEKIDEKIAACTDEEEKKKLLKEKAKIQYDYDCEQVFTHAKSSILKHLEGTRIQNIRIQGYEADDISYLFTKLVPETGDRGLIISVDGDWKTFINPSVDYWKEAYSRKYGKGVLCTMESSKFKFDAEKANCTLYEMGNLREIYTGGHNNVPAYTHKKEIDMIEFSKRMKSGDETLPDFSIYYPYFKALNINNYDNKDALDYIKSVMNCEFLKDNHQKIAFDYFNIIHAKKVKDQYKNIENAKIEVDFIL